MFFLYINTPIIMNMSMTCILNFLPRSDLAIIWAAASTQRVQAHLLSAHLYGPHLLLVSYPPGVI